MVEVSTAILYCEGEWTGCFMEIKGVLKTWDDAWGFVESKTHKTLTDDEKHDLRLGRIMNIDINKTFRLCKIPFNTDFNLFNVISRDDERWYANRQHQ